MTRIIDQTQLGTEPHTDTSRKRYRCTIHYEILDESPTAYSVTREAIPLEVRGGWEVRTFLNAHPHSGRSSNQDVADFIVNAHPYLSRAIDGHGTIADTLRFISKLYGITTDRRPRMEDVKRCVNATDTQRYIAYGGDNMKFEVELDTGERRQMEIVDDHSDARERHVRISTVEFDDGGVDHVAICANDDEWGTPLLIQSNDDAHEIAQRLVTGDTPAHIVLTNVEPLTRSVNRYVGRDGTCILSDR